MKHPARLCASLITASVVLAACDAGPVVAPATTPPGTLAPPTTTAPTTTAPTTSTMPATTAVATTLETLPTPADPPNPAAKEPRVVLGTIEIPRIHIAKKLLEGVSLGVLDEAPGHWPGTAMPGHLGNVVVAGHRTVYDKPFHDIDQLAKGDEVVFTTAEGRFVYKVTSTEIVTPDAMRIIDQAPGHTATLFACHPLGSTRERIVVHLELA